jgi:hypothetical protein
MGMLHRTVWAKVLRPVTYKASGKENPWERFVLYAYPWVTLAVLEEDIVFGLVSLDEVVLEEQGKIASERITAALKSVVPTFKSPEEINSTAERSEEMMSAKG